VGESAATNLLLVDDEPNIRITLQLLLEQHGFSVRTAADLKEAKALISTHDFDVLISDLNISSEADGFDVIRVMRAHRPQCLNFILTGFPGFDSAVEGIREQIADYFVKPIAIEDLVRGIKTKLKSM